METPFLVAGLGNPGKEYHRTRHNAGFLLADRLAYDWGTRWTEERKFLCRLAWAEESGKRILLAEPQTFMNASGESVRKLSEFYRVEPGRILILVDDADLGLGQIRMRRDGSSGGHHGLESVAQHLGTVEFARLRLGIGRTERGVREITGHVLGQFSGAERGLLEKVLERGADQVRCWIKDGIEQAMNRYNGAVGTEAKNE